MALGMVIFILMRLKDCCVQQNGDTIVLASPFEPRPLMVQSPPHTLANVTRLTIQKDPPHFIKDRRNHGWLDHGVLRHVSVEKVPDGCVGEAWAKDHHPSCNLFHDIDMKDFFFNDKRSLVNINGHRHRQKIKYIGGGGFRSAFLFHEYNGTRRVLKTLLYREDRDFTPRMVDRMRRDAVASEQLTASPYIVDIYGYCAQSALVDYSNNDDMLRLFKHKQKPTKDELFQIAHDVAQSVADAHHFNHQGRATIAHMDIKPNQWIQLNGKYMLNDFNLARFLTWDTVEKKNCHFTSGYSEGRVSR